ncbi:MAG: hypothetical protein ACREX8_01480, partial [Gammaproteobacteria bacterium]
VQSVCREGLPAGYTGHQAVLECVNTQDTSQVQTIVGPPADGDGISLAKCNPPAPPWHSARHFTRLLN